ncbi:hypothetical protein Ahy_B05g078252 [Arachis hypogaea]|uniref:Protein FAR1-RELATED SEQUENCE n=1 Tax=Arachis hypogaea TaxID=3818 RepID=A0A444Z6N1_ARAHY|nr:hypothetical protein Ahy_B05g078252 [Arachis hypogaea]
MGGKTPKGILTDQCASMQRAIEMCMPTTIHRWCICKQRAKREREFDAEDFHTVIPCATKSAIEAQFQHLYTHEKFREVQAQFREKVNCITKSMHSTLGFTTYEVVEQVSNYIQQVFRHLRRSITRSKVSVPAVRVKGHTLLPFPERLKFRASS